MTTSEVITAGWLALRAENYSHPGIYERRIFANSAFAIFAALERPATLPYLFFNFHLKIDELPPFELRGVNLRTEYLPGGLLRVRLGQSAAPFEEIFTLLAADVVTKVLSATSEREAFDILLLRLTHWQRFTQATGPQGLTIEQQAGLFGELTLLRTLLVAGGDHSEVLGAWQGPLAANQDFARDGRAIEVKTTTTNALDDITVANEYQLDDTGLSALYLCQLGFEVRKDTGVTLPLLIAEILGMLPAEQYGTVYDQLLQAGYVDSQKHLYVSRRYVERRRTYYLVGGAFPRIVTGQLPNGVSRVRYHINMNGCATYRQTEPQVLKNFLASHHD